MTSTGTLCERLGEFSVALDYDGVPAATHAQTKLHILDILGCTLFATRLPLARSLLALAEINTEPGSASYSVLGMGYTQSPGDAALLNGILGAAFELDTGGAYVHPAPPILGAALAAAEHARYSQGKTISGIDFMMAFLVGHEITVRVSEWVGFAPEHHLGWHTPAFHGAIGAAAAAARLLGLDADRTASALAIAVDMAGGGLIHARNDSKRVHTGRAAHSGYMAAVLSAGGVDGGLDVLEHPRWGYYRAMRFGADTIDPAANPYTKEVAADLFTRFDSYAKLAFKYYPFHSAGQTILDTVTTLRRTHHVDPAQVTAIKIGVSTFMHDHDAMLRPAETLATANFSFPYAAALALVRDISRLTEPGVRADAFLEAFADQRVRALQSKVTCEISPELDAENLYNFDTIIEIRLQSGETLKARTEYGKRARATGSLGSIAFDTVESGHLSQKFLNLTSPVIGAEGAQAVIQLVSSLGSEADLTNLIAGIAQHSGGRHPQPTGGH
jgi:2-methylcitrate dehydratase PrpD